MSKHTPGDWHVETDERYGPDHAYIRTGKGRDGVHICTMNRSVGHRLTPPSDIAADARLIASAPDLLAACEEAAWAIESYCEDHAGERPTDVTVVLPALLSAIAKAGGAK